MKKKIKLRKQCPNCKKNIYYSNENTLRISIKKNTKCYNCSGLGRVPWNKGITKYNDVRMMKISHSLQKRIIPERLERNYYKSGLKPTFFMPKIN